MSVLARKQPVSTTDKLRGHAANAVSPVASKIGPAAGRAVPLAQQAAQQAVPLARSAGSSVKQGADGAVAWATPYVDAARSWAAPQIEQSAHAISESLAPMISNALVSAAQRIDATPQKPAKRRGKLTAAAMLTAVAGLVTLVAMRLKRRTDGFAAATADPGDSGVVSQSPAEDAGPDPDMNGQSGIV